MDPITTAIIAGVASGVATGVATSSTDAGLNVVGKAYTTLKNKLFQKFGPDSDMAEAITRLEKKPDSEARQKGVAEEIIEVGAYQDEELVAVAQGLLKALAQSEQGQQILGKYQIQAPNSQIGVIGDNAEIKGGINFGKKDA